MSKKHTAQRQMILDALKTLDHPTAQEVFDEVKKRYAHMSMATVYRNLHTLAQEGVLKQLPFPDSPDRFDVQMHAHYHMTCTRCGRIFNIDQSYFNELDEAVEQSTGFSIQSHSIFFKGVCPLCKEGTA